jgi:DNA polymerase-3 subunit beta
MSLIFNISRNDFLSGLSSLQNVTSKKGTIAILSNVLLESKNDSIILTATDLEIGIRHIIPAEILSGGTITLPSRKLFEIIRESGTEQIHLEIKENNWAKITADSSSYNLAGIPGDEFPLFPEYKEENLVALKSEIVKELIDKTIYCVAQDSESQFNLTGVLVEKEIDENKNCLRMVTSDGHRLSLMECEAENDLSQLSMEKTILIPRRGIQEIRKFCESREEIKISFEDKQAVIKSNDSIIIIRLLNGDFPDYRNIIQVINKASYVDIEKVQLVHSMKRMNLFTEDRYNAVQFNIEKDLLILSSQNIDLGSARDEIKIKYSGEPFKLGFNGKYFLDTLSIMDSDIIKVYINSEESPCMIQGDADKGFISIIMPMKI